MKNRWNPVVHQDFRNKYNFLNLPDTIQFRNGNAIYYTYDASGMKLQTKHITVKSRLLNPITVATGQVRPLKDSETQSVLTTDYVGNHVFEDGELKMTLFPGGYTRYRRQYVENLLCGLNCYYNQDYQGNNRDVVTASGEFLQRTEYTPFGVSFPQSAGDAGVQPYKYSGKELDKMHGLNYYDFHKRFYDPLLASFLTIDPLCEKYYSVSPYAYCNNNPVRFVDLHGDSVNVAILMIHDNMNNTSYTQTLTGDLQSQTGLTVSVSANGQMTYAKDANGQPIIATTTDASGNVIQSGSATARSHLIGLIDNQSTVNVGVSNGKGSKGGGSDLWLDPTQINSFISGSVNVDNRTLGWGMTFLHESYHTTIGGSLPDSPYNPGPVVTNMNVIRSELNAQGGNYGQRLDYYAIPIGTTNVYIPFNVGAQDLINARLIPGATPGDKFIRRKP